MNAFGVSGIVRPVGVALITLGLSGCLGGPGPTTVKTGNPTASSGAVTIAALTPEKTEAKPLAAIPKPTPKPKPAPEKFYPPPSRLTGMSHYQVIGLLGKPKFKRQDDPALIWQYRTETCALDVFLYRTGDGPEYRVDYFEARNRKKGKVTAKDCFTALLKAHEQRRTG